MKVIGFETMREKFLLAILIVAVTVALFFAYVSYQMSAFYTDLLRMAGNPQISSVDMVKYLALLDKYEWAWYLPQNVGAVFAVIAAFASIVIAVLIFRKTS